MASWSEFEAQAPELAEFGRRRFAGGVAYLATVRQDGGPRVHPVTPIIGAGRLFVFMEPTSPKGHDLRRDGRYALHCAVHGSDGGEGEFWVSGQAVLVVDPDVRAQAAQSASYSPQPRYILFELGVERAASTVYVGEQTVRAKWQADQE